mgnify:CR=1 FL=1
MRHFLVGFIPCFALGCGAVFALLTNHSGKSFVEDSAKQRVVLRVAASYPRDHRLQAADLLPVQVPAHFVTASNVLADEAELIVDQRLSFKVEPGDLVTWSLFADRSRIDMTYRCAKTIETRVAERRAAAIDEGLALMTPGGGELELVPPTGEDVQALALAADAVMGEVLRNEALTTVSVPQALVTGSLVLAVDRPKLAGKRLLVPTVKGELLAWQMVDDAEKPRTALGCETVLAQRADEAERKLALELAQKEFGE